MPSFGPPDARLLIVGLAPGLRGANRTGRPFTGDYAGDLLYATLHRIRLRPRHIRGAARRRADARRRAHHQRGALRAAGEQADAGRDHHLPRVPHADASPRCRTCAPSSRSAASRHDTALTALGAKRAAAPFAHGARARRSDGLTLFDSYHCSRYNTNTGVLTPEMFRAVFAAVRKHLDESQNAAL